MKKAILALSLGASVLMAASSAGAIPHSPSPPPPPTACSVNDITPHALACAGFFSGNLLSNQSGDITAQKNALSTLGFTWDGNWNTVEKLSNLNGSHTVDFTTLLRGVSYVAFHFGNGQGGPGNATAFYKLDGGTGLDIITLAYNASSNAVLYSTGAIPEPATWAMMLTGFFGMGALLRRRRNAAALPA